MSAITIEGDLIHYEKLGRGRPVILVHGWIGSWRYWIPLMQQLHVRFSVYTLDLLGFGDSAKNAEGYALANQVELLRRFMEQLAIPKAAMIGHGLGALVLGHFAHHYPERVARLLLVSAPLFDVGTLRGQPALSALRPTDSANPRAATPFATPTATPNLLAEIINERSIYLLLEKCFKKTDPTYEKLRVDLDKADPAAIRGSVQGFDSAAYLRQVRALACPTVAVHGVDDPVIPAPSDEIWHYLTAERDDLFVPIPISGVRHFPMLEHEPFIRLAGEFLDAPDISKLEVRDRWRRRSR
ncbi:alpha/beta hydrolase [Aggregatilineales bacterium SYSU G02658]